ncbi:SDR family NAD(P)-dependent oxidoreductase [Acidimangrovimonas sediminis]|uniref:SDR family NAD(P)-dependent oxidoreductase n=1 Tax=Acidimangrovimonas sediminis TaxID=2056283 RepID=UPI000C7FCB4D|nr:SDR family oxidoreductase [Acidimangrovimonas sediminis]
MRILVTGASDGIGGAVCRQLAREAAEAGRQATMVLTTTGRNGPPDRLATELEATGARCLTLAGDLTDAGTCRRIAAETLAFCGGLDIFVSNAGGGAPAPLAEVTLETWDRQFALNVRPTLILAQELHVALRESRGTIVAVASMSGMQAHPGQGAYAPAKAALLSLCRNLAQEWAADGIRVNAVSPGMIRTPLTERTYHHEETAQTRRALVPLGRIGTPEDIAATIAFLAGPGAGYITGQNILADGGLSDSVLGHVPLRPA